MNTSRVYKAFEAQDKLFRLDTHRASHSHLFDIFYSDRYCTSFVLAFNFTTLAAKGHRKGKCLTRVFPREASYFAFRLDAN